jgi:hypothetical protein
MVLLIGDVQQAVGSESDPPRPPKCCRVAGNTSRIKPDVRGACKGGYGHIRHDQECSVLRRVSIIIDYLNGVRTDRRVGVDCHRKPGSSNPSNDGVLAIDLCGNLFIEVGPNNVN